MARSEESAAELPPGYDQRLSKVLDDPLGADVEVAFYDMAASKNPRFNYRWELHSDGRLFMVRHSGRDPEYAEPYDRPLPSQPTTRIDDVRMQRLRAMLDETGFFDQPTLQRATGFEGGSFYVVRARRDNVVHEVVYENVEPPLVDYLHALTD